MYKRQAYNLLWDQENRLSEVRRQGVTKALYTYDGDGKRVKAQLTATSGTTYRTFYVGGFYEYTQNNGTGVTTEAVRYYDAGGKRVALRRDAVIPATTLYWVLADQVNSTTKTILDSTYAVNSELRYKPWGTARYSSGSTPTTKRFTGQREDAGVGLYYYNARYYEPVLGRFISPDSMVPDPNDPQDLNRYAYVKNNPIRHDDPTGHYIESALDVAFIVNDIREIRSGGMTWMNGLALAADVGGLLLPGLTGGGLAVRAVRAGFKAANKADMAVNAYNTLADGQIDAGDVLLFGSSVVGAGKGRLGIDANQLDGVSSHNGVISGYKRSNYGRPTLSEHTAARSKTNVCPYCGTQIPRSTDHIRSQHTDWNNGGHADTFEVRTARVNHPDNLIGSCGSCNSSKQGRSIGDQPGQWWPPGWQEGEGWPYGGP